MISELFTRSSSFFDGIENLEEVQADGRDAHGPHRIFVVNVHRCRGQSKHETVTPTTTAIISGENAYIASGMNRDANAVWESEFAIDIDLNNTELRSDVFCVCVVEASTGNAVGSVYIPYWEVMELQPHAQHRLWRPLQRPSKAVNGALQTSWNERKNKSVVVDGGQYWPLCEIEISIAIVKVRSLPRLLTLVSDFRREMLASCEQQEAALKSLGDEALGGTLAKKLKALRTAYLDSKTSDKTSDPEELLFRELEENGSSNVGDEITYASRLSQLVSVGFGLLIQELEHMEVPLPPRGGPKKINSKPTSKRGDDSDDDGEESEEIKAAEEAFQHASELALEVALPTVEFLKSYSLEVTKGAEERMTIMEQALKRFQNSVVKEDAVLKAKQDQQAAQEREDLMKKNEESVEMQKTESQDQLKELERLHDLLKQANERLVTSEETIATLTEDNTNLFEKWTSLEVVEERAEEMARKLIDLEVDNRTTKEALKESEAQRQEAVTQVEELSKTNRDLQEEVENLFASAAGISPSSL